MLGVDFGPQMNVQFLRDVSMFILVLFLRLLFSLTVSVKDGGWPVNYDAPVDIHQTAVHNDHVIDWVVRALRRSRTEAVIMYTCGIAV